MKRIIAKILLVLLIIGFTYGFIYTMFIDPIRKLGWYGLLVPVCIFAIFGILMLIINFITNNIN